MKKPTIHKKLSVKEILKRHKLNPQDKDLQKIIEFCSLVNSNNQETCFKQMGSGMLDWNADKVWAKESCKKIPDPQGSLWCLSAI